MFFFWIHVLDKAE